MERRSNLHGVTLKAMTERQPPYMTFPLHLRQGEDSEWITNPSGDQVKDVTGKLSLFKGLFLDVLRVFEKEMNFTAEVVIRRYTNFYQSTVKDNLM